MTDRITMPSLRTIIFLVIELACVYSGGYFVYRIDSFWSMFVGAALIGVGLGIAQFEGYLDSRED